MTLDKWKDSNNNIINERVIHVYPNGNKLIFFKGSFDNYAVGYVRKKPNKNGILETAPLDKDYFNHLISLSEKYGTDTVYNDFCSLYEKTNSEIDNSVFSFIHNLSSKYENSFSTEVVFGILYLTMIAEENKAFAKLGKRIKRLGVYQILKEDIPCEVAVNFSKGKKWKDLNEICKARGF